METQGTFGFEAAASEDWRAKGYFAAPIAADIKDRVVELYLSETPMEQIAERLGIGMSSVGRILKKRGIPSRRCGRPIRIREDAFDTITEESAYWIGFLMADGCVADEPGRSKRVVLGLSTVDAAHVEKFRNFLGSPNTISISSKNNGFGAANGKGIASLTVASDRIVEALARYGLTPRKSLTAQVVGLENNRDFWRGAIDGDGCLMPSRVRGNGYSSGPGIEICGSLAMVEQFRGFVLSHHPSFSVKTGRHGNISKLQLRCHVAYKMIRVLYEGCTVSLDRKMRIAEEILAQPEPRDNSRFDDLSLDDLLEMRSRAACWGEVAAQLGITRRQVWSLKARRVQKAKRESAE